MKKLHTPTTTGEHNDESSRSAHDPHLPGPGVAATSSGIASVALLPNRKATAVTVGADGKCCVVDFTQPSRNKAVLLSTWRLRRPATSMSVVYARDSPFLDQADGPEDWSAPSGKDFCIAIGRQDGKVMLFDLDGNLLSEELLDSRRNRIVDVEWETSGPVRPKVPRRKASSLAGALNVVNIDASSETTTREQSLGNSLPSHTGDDSLFDLTRPAVHGTISPPRNPIRVPEGNHSDKDGKTPIIHPRISGISVGALNHLDLSKGFTTFREDDLPPMRRKKKQREVQVYQKPNSQERSQCCEEQDIEEPTSASQRSCSPPAVPPRPTPKEDGLWYLRRAQKALEAAAADPSREIIINGRRVSAASLRSHHRESVSSHSKKRILMGPRPHRKRSPPVSLRAKVASLQDTSFTTRASEALGFVPKGVTVSPARSAKSYETASTRLGGSGDSETSSDTIVDWSTGVRRRPGPTRTPSENEPFLTSKRMPLAPTKLGSLTFPHRPNSKPKSKAMQAFRKSSGKAMANELKHQLLLDASQVDTGFQSKVYWDLKDIELRDGAMPDEATSSVPALRIDKAKRREKGHISITVSPASSNGLQDRHRIYPDLADLDYDPDSTPSEGQSLQDRPESARQAKDELSLGGDDDTGPAAAALSADTTDSVLGNVMPSRHTSASTRPPSGHRASATSLDPARFDESSRLNDDPDQTDVNDQQDLVADSATAVILDCGHYSRPLSGTIRPMSTLHMVTQENVADQSEVAHQGRAGSVHTRSKFPQEAVETLHSQSPRRFRVSAIPLQHSCKCGEDIRDFLSSCFADLSNKESIRNEELKSQIQALLSEQDRLFRATVQGVEKRLLKNTCKSPKPQYTMSRSQRDGEWEDVTDSTERSQRTGRKGPNPLKARRGEQELD